MVLPCHNSLFNSGLAIVNSNKNHVESGAETAARVVLKRASSLPNLFPADEQHYGKATQLFGNFQNSCEANRGDSHLTSGDQCTAGVVLKSTESFPILAPTDERHYDTGVPSSDSFKTLPSVFKEKLDVSRKELQDNFNQQLSQMQSQLNGVDQRVAKLIEKADDFEQLMNKTLKKPAKKVKVNLQRADAFSVRLIQDLLHQVHRMNTDNCADLQQQLEMLKDYQDRMGNKQIDMVDWIARVEASLNNVTIKYDNEFDEVAGLFSNFQGDVAGLFLTLQDDVAWNKAFVEDLLNSNKTLTRKCDDLEQRVNALERPKNSTQGFGRQVPLKQGASFYYNPSLILDDALSGETDDDTTIPTQLPINSFRPSSEVDVSTRYAQDRRRGSQTSYGSKGCCIIL